MTRVLHACNWCGAMFLYAPQQTELPHANCTGHIIPVSQAEQLKLFGQALTVEFTGLSTEEPR